MHPFERQRILLGVTGGIAAYKAAWLARLLTQHGAEVDVVLTRSATDFVGAVTFEALTGRPVHTALVAAGHALDHIRLARAASLVLIAPATADFLARAAGGHADDLLGACLLATEAPVLIVPAMNDRMWANPAVRRNRDALAAIGYTLLDPDDGPLAVGEGSGPGRMPEPERIVEHAARLLNRRERGAEGDWSGQHVVVTAGPTREAVDPVRFISNRSSGRMGVELAAAAWRRGARVTLVAGPLEVAVPVDITHVRVETTREMCIEVTRAIATADALLMAAAPADFTPSAPAGAKIKKSGAPPTIELTATEDILRATRDARRPGTIVVGFALETGDPRVEARRKLREKGLDLVVANDALESGAGFGVSTNRVTLVSESGDEALPLLSKREVAERILDRVEVMRRGR